jgi:hypothetical protein
MAEDDSDPLAPRNSWKGPISQDFIAQIASSEQAVILNGQSLALLLTAFSRLMSCQFYDINSSIVSASGNYIEADRIRQLAQHNFGTAAEALQLFAAAVAPTPANKQNEPQ